MKLIHELEKSGRPKLATERCLAEPRGIPCFLLLTFARPEVEKRFKREYSDLS